MCVYLVFLNLSILLYPVLRFLTPYVQITIQIYTAAPSMTWHVFAFLFHPVFGWIASSFYVPLFFPAQDSWLHTEPKDTSTWSHAPFMYGTALKTTSYEPFGIRLRPDAPVFSCIHARNKRSKPLDFNVHWEMEYEVLVSPDADPRAMLVAWFVMQNDVFGVDPHYIPGDIHKCKRSFF
jgi:hypothetical protein